MIPDSVLDGDIGVFAKKGAGKTYLMKGLVERLLAQGRRVVILDPLGFWWGLRFAPDGSRGLSIPIVGGRHGDFMLGADTYPPTVERAEALAAWVATGGSDRLILDLSELRRGEMIRFATAFLAELYRKNDEALWLVLEEADVFAPQQPMNDQTRLLHEIDQIARRGRAYGFRLWSATQRPAKLHTDVRAMLATLVAMRITSPHDREAVERWIVGNADKTRAAEIVGSLASLEVGEGWVWAPDVDLLERQHFPAITTLDTSATPKAGQARQRLGHAAEVDGGALSQIMRGPAEPEAEAEPAPGPKLAVVTPEQLAAARAEGYERGHAEGVRQGLEEARRAAFSAVLADLRPVVARIESAAYGDEPEPERPKPALVAVQAKPAISAQPEASEEPVALGGGVQRILDAIAWWEAAGHEAPLVNQVAYIAGYSPKSGTWDTYVSRARSANLIEKGFDGRMRATEEGRRIAKAPPHQPNGAELRASVRGKLPQPIARMYDVLVAAYPSSISTKDWAERAGYSPTSGTADTYRSRARSLALAVSAPGGHVRAAGWLFPDRSGE